LGSPSGRRRRLYWETILLAEDSLNVRELTRELLEARGYTIIEATSGEEALEICKSHPGNISLILSDIIMNKMTGRELAEQAVQLRRAVAAARRCRLGRAVEPSQRGTCRSADRCRVSAAANSAGRRGRQCAGEQCGEGETKWGKAEAISHAREILLDRICSSSSLERWGGCKQMTRMTRCRPANG